MRQTLNSLLELLSLMAAGIKNHLGDLTSVGINEETANDLKAREQKLKELNAQQEELKSQLKEKTKELQDYIDETSKVYSDTKKLIKVKADKVNWRAFGIEDKR